jgi:5'-3' exonuclease
VQVVLGLATHEPYFSLLREEEEFGRSVGFPSVSVTDLQRIKSNFYLLSLTMLREYIFQEFQSLQVRLVVILLSFDLSFPCSFLVLPLLCLSAVLILAGANHVSF